MNGLRLQQRPAEPLRCLQEAELVYTALSAHAKVWAQPRLHDRMPAHEGAGAGKGFQGWDAAVPGPEEVDETTSGDRPGALLRGAMNGLGLARPELLKAGDQVIEIPAGSHRSPTAARSPRRTAATSRRSASSRCGGSSILRVCPSTVATQRLTVRRPSLCPMAKMAEVSMSAPRTFHSRRCGSKCASGIRPSGRATRCV